MYYHLVHLLLSTYTSIFSTCTSFIINLYISWLCFLLSSLTIEIHATERSDTDDIKFIINKARMVCLRFKDAIISLHTHTHTRAHARARAHTHTHNTDYTGTRGSDPQAYLCFIWGSLEWTDAPWHIADRICLWMHLCTKLLHNQSNCQLPLGCFSWSLQNSW